MVRGEKKEVAYSTYRQNKSRCNILSDYFEGKTVRQVDEEAVKGYIDEQMGRVSKGTVSNHITTLSGILDLAVSKGIISDNPAKTSLIPKGSVKTRAEYTLEDGELEKLIAVSQKSFRLVIYLGAVLGLRRAEILGLKVTDLREGVLSIRRSWGEVAKGVSGYKPTKTEGSNRDVPVPDWLVKKWNEHVSNFAVGQVMFPGRGGNPMGRDALRVRWGKAKKAAGVNPELHFHDLRGYAGTEFVKKGATEREVMALLGHTSTQVSISYQKATLSALSEVMDGRRKA